MRSRRRLKKTIVKTIKTFTVIVLLTIIITYILITIIKLDKRNNTCDKVYNTYGEIINICN